MSKKNKKKPEFKMADIDLDVLETIQKQEIEKVLSDDKLFNRALLSAFAELLSEMKKLSQAQDDLLSIISMLSNEKLQDFFYGVKEAYEQAEKDEQEVAE
jgi:hypothetical protein